MAMPTMVTPLVVLGENGDVVSLTSSVPVLVPWQSTRLAIAAAWDPAGFA